MGLAGELKPWILLGLGLLGLLAAAWVFDRVMEAVASRPRVEDDDSPQAKRTRRATSGAAFALQQVFDPGIEHVIRAERDAQAEEDDSGSGEGNDADEPGSFLAALMETLKRVPIDPEEVRRVLTAAQRAGCDWRPLYDEAVHDTLAALPSLAPTVPPTARVAPREGHLA